MAYKFTNDWASEIAEVTESPEFQTAQITITDDSLVTGGEYDPDTGETSPAEGDAVVYSGRARIIPINNGSFLRGDDQANATTITNIRVQVPYSLAPERVRRGAKVFVDSAPYGPALIGRVFVVGNDLQGSSAASRTFDCHADEDVVVA